MTHGLHCVRGRLHSSRDFLLNSEIAQRLPQFFSPHLSELVDYEQRGDILRLLQKLVKFSQIVGITLLQNHHGLGNTRSHPHPHQNLPPRVLERRGEEFEVLEWGIHLFEGVEVPDGLTVGVAVDKVEDFLVGRSECDY